MDTHHKGFVIVSITVWIVWHVCFRVQHARENLPLFVRPTNSKYCSPILLQCRIQAELGELFFFYETPFLSAPFGLIFCFLAPWNTQYLSSKQNKIKTGSSCSIWNKANNTAGMVRILLCTWDSSWFRNIMLCGSLDLILSSWEKRKGRILQDSLLGFLQAFWFNADCSFSSWTAHSLNMAQF